MAQLAKIETAKVPASVIAGVKAPATSATSNVVTLQMEDASYQRLGVWVLILVFSVFAAWSAFAPLGSYAVASGKVITQTQNQVIQHREGGVIEDISVDDGDYVKKGQQLMIISPTDAKAEKGMVQEQLLSSLGLEARLNAQLEGFKKVRFPDELSVDKHQRAASIIAEEQQQFKVIAAATVAETAVLEQRIQRLKEQSDGTDSQIAAQRELEASYAREVGELKSLVARQLISKLQLDETVRNQLTVKTSIAELDSTKAGLKVQVAEAQEQLVLQDNNRKKETAAMLSDTRAKIADLRNRMASATDKLERTIIAAPMSGTVVALAYHTKGGVVSSGSKIMEIVPEGSAFEVEARVGISDIDKVQVGREADIRFPAFPAVSFLKVTPGEVVYVSADTLRDETNGQQYYRAKVKIKPEGLAVLQQHSLDLVQGMPAEVSIKSGQRTFLDYLMKPLSNMVNHAFNED